MVRKFVDYVLGRESEYCLDRSGGLQLVVGVALALFYYNVFDMTAAHQWYVPAIATAATWWTLFYGIPMIFGKVQNYRSQRRMLV